MQIFGTSLVVELVVDVVVVELVDDVLDVVSSVEEVAVFELSVCVVSVSDTWEESSEVCVEVELPVLHSCVRVFDIESLCDDCVVSTLELAEVSTSPVAVDVKASVADDSEVSSSIPGYQP